MINLTKEDFTILKEYEKTFHQAVYSDFLRVVDFSILSKIMKIYTKYTGDNNINLSCSSCILKYIKKMGVIYFNNKIEFVNKEREIIGKVDSYYVEQLDEMREVLQKNKRKPTEDEKIKDEKDGKEETTIKNKGGRPKGTTTIKKTRTTKGK